MSEIICPKCHALNRSSAKFCSDCGTGLQNTLSQPSSENAVDTAAAAARSAEPVDQAGDVPPSPTGPEPVGSASVPAVAGAPEGKAADEKQLTGKVINGRYKLSHELGRGGFGAVYEAWDANLNRKCAIKENLDPSPEASRQFAREASVLANLSHPNLPRVTDHFSISGQGQYLVMDFVDGEDLDSLVKGDQPLDVDQALTWMIQVAGALVYLHSRTPAIVHRDIKPSNIRITSQNQAMLVDFGLVKMLDPLLRTTMGARAVTPGYAPPEQYGIGRTDARTDVYALGATIYKILTGREPLESVLRVAGMKMEPAHAINPQVPLQLSQTIEKAIALDPSARFQSADEFRAALDSARATLQVGRSPVSQPAMITRSAPVPQATQVSLPRPHSEAVVPPGTPVSRPPSRPPSGPLPQAAAPRRLPWVWIVAGGLVLALIVCIGAGGGMWAWLGLRGVTPTAVGQIASATAASLPGATDTSAPSTPTGVEAATATDAPPTASPTATMPAPTSTPDPAFLSPDPATYVHVDDQDVGTFDPALAYTTGSLAVIQNIYDTLIFYRRESPNDLIPQLALEVPSLENGGISADGLVYTFKIRPNVSFHDGSILTVEDVVYTFQRNILQGGSASPMLLLTEPILGVGIYDISELVGENLIDNREGLAQADAAQRLAACQKIQAAIQADPAAGTVTFRLAQPWGPFLPTLANGWSAILSKKTIIAHGGWDGDCATWHNFYAPTLVDQNQKWGVTGSIGTGPYKLESYKAGEEVMLKANETYWRTEPAWPGGPSGAPRLKTVIIRYRFRFSERLALVKSGDADSLSYSTNSNWPELDAISGLVCKLEDDRCEPGADPAGRLESIRGFATSGRSWDIFMNWEINPQSNPTIGSGKLDGNGIPPNFFANAHVRRAFATCFNYDSYLFNVMLGEGVRSINVMLPGMIGYDPSSAYYRYDPQRCAEEFRQAVFDSKSVWDTGFLLKLPVQPDQPAQRKIAEIFRTELAAVNSRFRVQLLEQSANQYTELSSENRLPFYHGSWLEDVHDPHNWVVPYSVSNFARSANLDPVLTGQLQAIINRGVIEPNPQQRAAIYQEFNQLYYDQVPAILLFQAMGRQYQQRWVRGWYNNPLLPGLYFYVLSKD